MNEYRYSKPSNMLYFRNLAAVQSSAALTRALSFEQVYLFSVK
ncbi:hypothetical protein GCM10010912_31250 [Paenibacillus albidus]|uniref:Uncharacterized protein n=1 Tax=Paenibacillus albidus TaxID=2041023 RepID=A0A917FJL5_9BACL|nr:hypothetical protein GCM10010912_31250 [Paenibacillus albidus]